MEKLKAFAKTKTGWLVLGGLLALVLWVSAQVGCQPCVDVASNLMEQLTKVHEEPVVVPSVQ